METTETKEGTKEETKEETKEGTKEGTKKKNWFNSLFTDKEWDFDLSKVMGFISMLCGFVAFFLKYDEGLIMAMLGFGAGLLGISKAKGD